MIQTTPISSLTDYKQVLNKVEKDCPMFLTKDGISKYAIINIEDYENLTTALTLAMELKKAEKSKHYKIDEIKEDLRK